MRLNPALRFAPTDRSRAGDGAYYQPNDDRQAKAGSIEYVSLGQFLSTRLTLAPIGKDITCGC